MRKHLKHVQHGEHKIEIEIERQQHGVVIFAKCGCVTRPGSLTMHPKMGRTPQEHLRDVHALADKLAIEAAGHAQNQKLLDDMFNDIIDVKPIDANAII